MAEQQLLVIGVGNHYRGDDAAGLLAAKRLEGLQSAGVAIKRCPGGGADLMDAWMGFQWVILVDAVRSGRAAGDIVRIDGEELDRLAGFTGVSSHGFGVAETLRLAGALGVLPPRTTLYGIEAGDFEAGSQMSPEVAGAVERVVLLIAEEVKCTSSA